MDGVIDRDEVLRIAQLAHLELDDEEVASITGELAKILDYVRQLDAVNIEGVDPTAYAGVDALPPRPDRIERSLDRSVVLAQAPNAHPDGFCVPEFVDEG